MMRQVVSAADLDVRLDSAPHILDFIGACYGVDGVLLQEDDLAATFYDLRTGLLGDLFQKCVNYRLRVGFVVANPGCYGPRFAELASEHRTHPHIRFFADKTAAWAWLAV